MNNTIDAKEKIKAALLKRGKTKVSMPEITKIFFVNFNNKSLLFKTVIDNRKVA